MKSHVPLIPRQSRRLTEEAPADAEPGLVKNIEFRPSGLDDRFQSQQLRDGIAHRVEGRPTGQTVVARVTGDGQVVGEGQSAPEIDRVVASAEISKQRI